MEETAITVLEKSSDEAAEEFHAEDSSTDIETIRADHPASLRERFAAFVVDSLILLHLAVVWIAGLFSFLKREPDLILILSTTGAWFFLYYMIFEATLSATPGKLLSHLRVRKKTGGTPSLVSLLVRNFFRLIDYPFFLFTIAGFFEATGKQQRLGDWVAKTVVVYKAGKQPRGLGFSLPRSGATRRTLAFSLDLLLASCFAYGILLSLPVSRPHFSLVMLNLIPLFTVLFFTFSEFLFQATAGKTVFGLKVIEEEGGFPSFSRILVRNLFRAADMSPVGYLCVLLSAQKQRPGDLVAGTFVTKGRSLRQILAIPFMLVLAVIILLVGLNNPQNFVRKSYHVEAGFMELPLAPLFIQQYLRKGSKELWIQTLELGENEERVKTDDLYSPGDMIYLLFRISGYGIQVDRAWVQADVSLYDAADTLVFDRKNIINSSLAVEGRPTARLVTRFALPAQISPGSYRLQLTLRDMFLNRKTQKNISLQVQNKG